MSNENFTANDSITQFSGTSNDNGTPVYGPHPRPTRNKITNMQRQAVIYNHERGMRAQDIANFLQLPRTTILTIIKMENNPNRHLVGRRGGDHRSKLNDQDKLAIQQWVDKDPCITLQDICTKIQTDLGKVVSKSTAQRCLKLMHYSIKRIILVPERRNTDETIDARKRYAENFLEIISEVNDDKIFFSDEVGFCVSMRNKHGRAITGSSPVLTVRQIRTRNISVCSTINKNGMLNFIIRDVAFNGERFVEYIREVFDQFDLKGLSNCVIIMDNAAIHRIGSVRNLFTERGHRLMFLPAYSPFLNPIENSFSKWKNLVRQANCKNEEELNNAISNSAKSITTEDCNGYWRNMFRYITKALNNEIIND